MKENCACPYCVIGRALIPAVESMMESLKPIFEIVDQAITAQGETLADESELFLKVES